MTAAIARRGIPVTIGLLLLAVLVFKLDWFRIEVDLGNEWVKQVPFYTPDLDRLPNASSSSPRVIRLEHNGEKNGRLLATFENGIDWQHTSASFMPPSFPIYESSDGGKTWTKNPISVVDDQINGWEYKLEPMLFEVPQPLGDLNPGVILLAGLMIAPNVADLDIQVYQSDDGGYNWTYRSSCTKGGHGGGYGVWEPYLQLDAKGNLVCFFADERRKEEGYSQFIGHVVSEDGGKTWGSEVMDVGIQDDSTRPGMPTVLKLSDGSYVMSFEVVGMKNSEVHVKFSRDGIDWGNPSDLGMRVSADDGSYFGGTPQMTIMPALGSRGESLILGGQMFFDATNAVSPLNGKVLLLNSQGGKGTWTRIQAPVTVWPPPSFSSRCSNYNPALLVTSSGKGILHIASHELTPHHCELLYAISELSKPIEP